MSILIEGDKFARIGNLLAVLKGATLIDGKGKSGERIVVTLR